MATASLGVVAKYVSWEEVSVSSDKGRRVVHYYLKRADGGSDLAIVGKEKTLRHMVYYHAIKNRSVLLSFGPLTRLKSRREVVDWLNSVVSDSLPPQFSYPAAGSAYNNVASVSYIESLKDIQLRKLGHSTKEFVWLGCSSLGRKRRKHYLACRRNGIKISVNEFVFVLADDHKRPIAYLEDMYEDSKGKNMAVVRWFHKIDEVGIVLPHNFNDREIFFSLCLQHLSIECIDGLATVLSPLHYEKFLNEARHTMLGPFVCQKIFENEDVRPFDVTQLKGYWKQEVLRFLYTLSSSKEQTNSDWPDDGFRPRKRLRHVKHDSGEELMESRGALFLDIHYSGSDYRRSDHCSVRGGEPSAFLSGKTDAEQNPASYLKVGSEVEVLCQDSGIRGCWFRASVIKKHKDKVKVRYQDIKDPEDEANNLEEWILASRIALPDQLGIRTSGRTVVRPRPLINRGRVSWVVDTGTAVDVWWHDGWWEGIVLHKESEDRIRVFFPGEKKESVFGHADLRHSQEWLGNDWMHLKGRPDIVTSIQTQLDTNLVRAKSDERKSAPTFISDASQYQKTEARSSGTAMDSVSSKVSESGKVVDLSKDDLLSQLRWNCSKKRRRCIATRHNINGGKISPDIMRSNASERFPISTALKVDHDNCKYMRDSLFSSAVVQSLTSLVMSRG